MGTEIRLLTGGHVDPEEVRAIMESESGRPAKLEMNMRDATMDHYSVFFSNPFDRRKSRSFRFHRSHGVEAEFRDRIEDGPYTYFAMGSFDGGERILRIMADRFGGYLMNDVGETREWVEPEAAQPRP